MQTAQEVYASTVLGLPPDERLRLAALILNDLTYPVAASPEYSEEWSDEDIADVRTATMRHLDTSYPEDNQVG